MRKVIVCAVTALLLAAGFTDSYVSLIAAQKRAEIETVSRMYRYNSGVNIPKLNYAQQSASPKRNESKYSFVEPNLVLMCIVIWWLFFYVVWIYIYEGIRRWEPAYAGSGVCSSIRGRIRRFLRNLLGKLFYSEENGEPDELINRLMNLKRNQVGAVPFESESDVALGYSLAYALCKSDRLSEDQKEKLNVLGQELNASQKRIFCFPGAIGDISSSWCQLLGLAFIVFVVYSLLRMNWQLGLWEAISCIFTVYWVFQTPAYRVDNIRRSWFFKLFFGALNLLKAGSRSAADGFAAGDGDVITIWKERYSGRVVHSETDKSGSFILFMFKLGLVVVVFVYLTKAALPILSLIFIIRNFILHK